MKLITFENRIKKLLQDDRNINWYSVDFKRYCSNYTVFLIPTPSSGLHSLSFYHNLVSGDEEDVTITGVKYIYLKETLVDLWKLVKNAVEEDEEGNLIIPLETKGQERMIALNNLIFMCWDIEKKVNILFSLIDDINDLKKNNEFEIYNELKYLVDIITEYIKSLNHIYGKIKDMRNRFIENKNESKNYLSSK